MVGGLALVLMLSAGCHNGAYRASKLPPRYAAPVVHSAHHVDLSRLSHSTLRNEVVYPGDLVKVSIATGLEDTTVPTWLLRLDRRGIVGVPLVGDVEIGGLELAAAEAAIHDASIERGIYRKPQVSVTVEQRRSNKVTVLGGVNKEGTYELPSNQSDLLAALVAAEGLADDADTIVEIRAPPIDEALASIPSGGAVERPAEGSASLGAAGNLPSGSTAAFQSAPASVRVDLAAAQPSAARLQVPDGGVVMVMRRPKHMVQVIGLVKKPGQFEVPADQELRLLDAIALAGGLTTELADKLLVVRHLSGREDAVVIQASIRKAKREHSENIRLAPGDVVSIEETPLTFITTELQKYFQFTVSAGSRLTAF